MRATTLLFCLVLLTACSDAAVESVKLLGARTTGIPVYEPSVVEEPGTFTFAVPRDFQDPIKHAGVLWHLSTHRPLAEVLAFYEAAAPAEDSASEDALGEGADVAGHGALLDLPHRMFRLPRKDGYTVEVAVYQQPRQRRVWFSILESAPITN